MPELFYVSQAVLDLMILQPLLPKCYDLKAYATSPRVPHILIDHSLTFFFLSHYSHGNVPFSYFGDTLMSSPGLLFLGGAVILVDRSIKCIVVGLT